VFDGTGATDPDTYFLEPLFLSIFGVTRSYPASRRGDLIWQTAYEYLCTSLLL
jgi:hypothetical protein